MNVNLENFDKWFSQPLRRLYADPDAGFVILMISFPLLERYLREKSGVHEADRLDDRYHNTLLGVFPELTNLEGTKDFWTAYRHGLLHQATFSRRARSGRTALSTVAITGRISTAIAYDSSLNEFLVNPREFAERVVKLILSDFSMFEGLTSQHHPIAQTWLQPINELGIIDSRISLNSGVQNPPLRQSESEDTFNP